jgi:hypothetical protein
MLVWQIYFNRTEILSWFRFGQQAGIGIDVILIFHDQNVPRRRTLFDLDGQDGAKAQVFISRSQHFVWSITDIRGETYPSSIFLGRRAFRFISQSTCPAKPKSPNRHPARRLA